MRRRLLWLVALAGLAWLAARRLLGRGTLVAGQPPRPDPAEALRLKLEQTRAREETPGATAPSAATLPPSPPAPSPAEAASPPPRPAPARAGSEELDERRQEVHERARSAAEEMRRSSSE
ncbi:MAG TPA: hypothetical protein VFA44_13740 [Gaiellaceae bacterium]|nr:hypothetical protein [Gaiellaceae bacterium]